MSSFYSYKNKPYSKSFSLLSHRFKYFDEEFMYTSLKVDNDNHSLFYITEGEYIITIDDITYTALPDHFIFVPKGTYYSSRMPSSKKTKFYKLWFNLLIDNDDFYKVMELSENKNFIIKASNPNLIKNTFNNIIEKENLIQKAIKIASFQAAVLIATNYIVDNLNKANLKEQEKYSPFYPVLKHMQENMHMGVNLTELASIMYMENTYFIRKFKNRHGVSPLQYFDLLRVNRAIDLILNTDLDLNDVAEQIGISDIYYFSRFIRKFGFSSPPEYRFALEQHEITKYIPSKRKNKS